MDREQVGKSIRFLRGTRGYTQAQLAEMIGVKHCTVAGWESGRVNIKPAYIEQLCDVLHCRKEEILGFGYIGKERDAQKNKLVEMFESLSEDHKHLLLVRARELQLLEKECYNTKYMAS